MEQEVIYAVFQNQKEDPIGHFLNDKYYEPFGSDEQLGHLDSQSNFIYYVVTPENPEIRVHGKLEGDTLIRLEDNLRLRVEPV